MKRFPAIAVLEFQDITRALVATDAMLKKAPIGLFKSGTVSRGRFLTLIAGTTASVEESYQEGIRVGDAAIIDKVILPHVHHQVYDCLLGKRNPARLEAMAMIETATVSANIHVTDRALKGTEVRLVEIRIADSLLWGKGLSIYQGELHEIQAAVEMATHFFDHHELEAKIELIPAPHEGLVEQLDFTSNFGDAKLLDLDGEVL